MIKVTDTKTFKVFLLALAISVTACDGAENESKPAKGKPGMKTAYMAYTMEKTYTPIKSASGSVVKFQHCVQAKPVDEAEAMIKMLYQSKVDEIKLYLERVATAKANNTLLAFIPVRDQSAALLEACPAGASATCERKHLVDYYYTKSEQVLSGFETFCSNSRMEIWKKFE